jgi:hypothetical protein
VEEHLPSITKKKRKEKINFKKEKINWERKKSFLYAKNEFYAFKKLNGNCFPTYSHINQHSPLPTKNKTSLVTALRNDLLYSTVATQIYLNYSPWPE